MEKYNVYRVGNPGCRFKRKLHDNALKRALAAGCMRYLDECRPLFSTVPHRTVFVYSLNYDTTEETLRKKFEAYGCIVKLFIVKDVVTGDSKGYGFIEYASSYDAEVAYYVSGI